jgi:hypothetical protein
VGSLGLSTATANDWLNNYLQVCRIPAQIYCFGIGKTEPLVVTPVVGRRAFLSAEAFVPDATGVAKADALCGSEAAALGGTFKALLPTTTQSAFDRAGLSSSGANWVRLDGVPIAASTVAFAAGTFQTPLNLTPVGYAGRRSVWTGGVGPSQVQIDTNRNCNNWSDPNGNANYGVVNDLQKAMNDISANGPVMCASSFQIYCVEP